MSDMHQSNINQYTDKYRQFELRLQIILRRFAPAGLAGGPTGAPGQGRAWLFENGQLHEVPLTLGLDDDTYSEVVAGAIMPGDMVIIGAAPSGTSGGQTTARPRLFGL